MHKSTTQYTETSRHIIFIAAGHCGIITYRVSHSVLSADMHMCRPWNHLSLDQIGLRLHWEANIFKITSNSQACKNLNFNSIDDCLIVFCTLLVCTIRQWPATEFLVFSNNRKPSRFKA